MDQNYSNDCFCIYILVSINIHDGDYGPDVTLKTTVGVNLGHISGHVSNRIGYKNINLCTRWNQI